jgi:OPA family glycerol-3-phosphate transporter-like MFS transporter 3
MVDVGAFIGGVVVGFLGDKYSYRAIFLSPLLFLGSILMFIVYKYLGQTPLPYYFLMVFIGFTMGGPYNVIGSAIAIDLG